MPEINIDELAEKLRNIRGTTFVSITTTTNPALIGGKGCPIAGVEKTATTSCSVGTNYKADIERRQEKEGQEVGFTPDRSWAGYDGGLVEHKGQQYLRARVDRVLEETYTLDGKEIPKHEVEPHLRKKSNKKQGVSNQSEMRRYDLRRISKIRMQGEEFIIKES